MKSVGSYSNSVMVTCYMVTYVTSHKYHTKYQLLHAQLTVKSIV